MKMLPRGRKLKKREQQLIIKIRKKRKRLRRYIRPEDRHAMSVKRQTIT
jgi:hypothetical protein